MRLLCCSSCSKDAFTKLFVANICPWVVLLWNRRGARQDYSQMIPHIRNNNNNNIVCFDTRKLFEPCTKFPPPQIPNIFMELILRPATTRINSKPPRKTTWPSLNMILRLQLRVASPLTELLVGKWQPKRSFQFERSRTISNSRTRPGWCQQ